MNDTISMSRASKIIGGMFGLEDEHVVIDIELPAIFQRPYLLLATARSGLRLLAKELAPQTVWLPSFLCPTMLFAFTSPVRFFSVDEQLQVADETWLEAVKHGDLVVFIDYFGFRTWDDVGAKAKARGAWVIEDAAQAFLNRSFSSHADYVVTSARKFVGVPDGCVLCAQNGAALPAGPLADISADWMRDALLASVGRRNFDRGGGERDWFERFRAAEATAPVEPTRMSERSTNILQCSIQWAEIAERRRANYALLAAELGRCALCPDLPREVVPLGFPIAVERRDAIRAFLFSQKVFPPVHWELPDRVPASFAAAHRLSERIMTIPCDQRYGVHDMHRVIDSFKKTEVQ